MGIGCPVYRGIVTCLTTVFCSIGLKPLGVLTLVRRGGLDGGIFSLPLSLGRPPVDIRQGRILTLRVLLSSFCANFGSEGTVALRMSLLMTGMSALIDALGVATPVCPVWPSVASANKFLVDTDREFP